MSTIPSTLVVRPAADHRRLRAIAALTAASAALLRSATADQRRRAAIAALTVAGAAVLLHGGDVPAARLRLDVHRAATANWVHSAAADRSGPAAQPAPAQPAPAQPAPAQPAPAPAPAPVAAPPLPITVKGGMRPPVDGGVLTSSFGQRWGRPHEGVDVSAPPGVPIRAVAGGIVAAAEPYYGYGLRTVVDHGNGVHTIYAHQSRLLAMPGTTVAPGDVIGLVGCTGHCTGPHLHFEVRHGGVAVDPLQFLG